MAMLRAPGGAPDAGAVEAAQPAAPLLAPAGGLPAPGGGITGARALRRMARAVTSNRKATTGVLLLGIFCVVAAIPGLIAPDDPNAEIYRRNLGVSARHLLGTTALG